MKSRTKQKANGPKERPIIFSDPMVLAILEGRKTVTRRIVKPKRLRVRVHELVQSDSSEFTPIREVSPGVYPATMNQHGAVWVDAVGGRLGLRPGEFSWVAPYGEPGDHLWVKEACGPLPEYPDALTLPEYEGGHNPSRLLYYADKHRNLVEHYGINFSRIRWRPELYMPRWASRITLEVISVRAERLHEITEEDARAEGVMTSNGVGSALERFKQLWGDIHGATGWQKNPFVWRVAFRRVEP